MLGSKLNMNFLTNYFNHYIANSSTEIRFKIQLHEPTLRLNSVVTEAISY